jgi:hypothetical protein
MVENRCKGSEPKGLQIIAFIRITMLVTGYKSSLDTNGEANGQG